ncbi:MAG: hypothetical protein K2M39_00870 [Muribaculaceae bacterium]|nr:hypothetical protein [Muribaculaceae bacterium]
MKKKLLITMLVLLIAGVATAFTYSKKEGGEIPTDGEQMRVLNFNGHRYICYRWYENHYNIYSKTHSAYSGAGLVHDPDCPCGKH